MSPGFFQDFMDECINLRLSPLVVNIVLCFGYECDIESYR